MNCQLHSVVGCLGQQALRLYCIARGRPSPSKGWRKNSKGNKTIEMSDYVAPGFGIPTDLSKDLEKLRPVLDVSLEAYELGAHVAEKRLAGDPFTTRHEQVSYMLFAKGFKTFQSTRTLSLSGCGSDALALCAVLFENVVDILYINEDTAARPADFIDFELVEKFRQVEKVLRHPDVSDDVREQHEGYREELEPKVRELQSRFPNRLGWSQQSLRSRAQAVGLDLDYVRFYFIFCGHKHTLPSAASGFVLSQDGAFDVVRGPHILGVFEALCFSTDWFLRLLDGLQAAFELALAADIGRLRNHLKTCSAEVRQQHPDLFA